MTSATNYLIAIAILCIVILTLIAVCVFLFAMWRMTQKEIENYHAPVPVPDIKWFDSMEDDNEYRTEV